MARPFAFSLIIFVFVAINYHYDIANSASCVELSGIGNDEDDVYSTEDLSSFYDAGTVFGGLIISAVGTGAPLIYETAVSIQIAMYGVITDYNTLSYYQVSAIEFFGRRDISESRRFCQPNETDSDEVDLFNLHQGVAYAYTIYYQFRDRYLTGRDFYVDNFMTPRGINATICDEYKYDSETGEIPSGDGDDDDEYGCLDTSTPWGLANVISNEILLFTANDGWNTDGSYSREYNRIPYSEFRDKNREYIPKNNPWVLEYPDHWQPLLESDGLGFLYHQEHSVPHVGYTGKSFVFSNDEICERSKNFKKDFSPDDYDYETEMTLAINRLRDLTERQKIEIEYFDNKITSLQPLFDQVLNGVGTPQDSFERIVGVTVQFLSYYEAVIAVWKEKIDFDRVRPNTLIQNLLSGEEITSYAGVTDDGESLGTQTYLADDWDAYIRTMPHSEYPSASACICQAWADVAIEYFESDDILDIIDGPLTVSIDALSSSVEPLSTPANDLLLEYYSFSEASQRCAQSRLEGGLHFTQSVPDGQELCKGIGSRIVETVLSLANGDTPQFIVDLNDETVTERDCYPSSSRGSRSSSRSNSRGSSSGKSGSKSGSSEN